MKKVARTDLINVRVLFWTFPVKRKCPFLFMGVGKMKRLIGTIIALFTFLIAAFVVELNKQTAAQKKESWVFYKQ